MKKIKILKISLIVIIFLIIGYWFTVNVFIPANISYSHSCDEVKFEEKYSNDYVLAGQVSQVLIQNETTKQVEKQIVVTIIDTDEETIKHEWIHIKQIEQKRLFNCEAKVRKRVNEMEAYLMSKAPNPIFNLIYGEPKI